MIISDVKKPKTIVDVFLTLRIFFWIDFAENEKNTKNKIAD